MFGPPDETSKAYAAPSEVPAPRPDGDFNTMVRLSLAQVEEGPTPLNYSALRSAQRCLSSTSSPLWNTQPIGVTPSNCSSPFAYVSPYGVMTRRPNYSPLGPSTGADFGSVYSHTIIGYPSYGADPCTPRMTLTLPALPPVSAPVPVSVQVPDPTPSHQQISMTTLVKHE